MIPIRPKRRIPLLAAIVLPPRPLQRQVETVAAIRLLHAPRPRHVLRLLDLVPPFGFPPEAETGSGALPRSLCGPRGGLPASPAAVLVVLGVGGDLFPNVRAPRLPVQFVLRLRFPPRPLIPWRLRGRHEPGQLARGRPDAVQALAVAALPRLRHPRLQVQVQRPHDRGAGADDGEVDLEDPRQRVPDPDPGVVVREYLPGIRRAHDADDAGDDAEAHEQVQGDLGPEFEPGFPQQEDGEAGADEVGHYGEDCAGQSFIMTDALVPACTHRLGR